ncbi:MAG: hypothetical protein LBB27_01025 [Tannerellaceae bacterium]|nr:hypothetical protein [Tannerellaceae bacterium]
MKRKGIARRLAVLCLGALVVLIGSLSLAVRRKGSNIPQLAPGGCGSRNIATFARRLTATAAWSASKYLHPTK